MASKPKTVEERLFPEIPEDLGELSDDDLQSLLKEHEVAVGLIKAQDEEFLDGLSAETIAEELKAGVEQYKTLKAVVTEREAGAEEFNNLISSLASEVLGEDEPEPEPEPEPEGDPEAEAAELADDEKDEDEVEETPEEKAELSAKPVLRRPPSPSAERRAAAVAQGAPLVAAAGLQEVRSGMVFDRRTLAKAFKVTANRRGKPSKTPGGIQERILIASAQFTFPDDRILRAGDMDGNTDKIYAVLPGHIPGVGRMTQEALVASGGLCAPLEPIYSMPNFASQARPVRDSLPSFQADRGGVNVPAATSIGDIDTAISVITEANDALGGTFATKSCQDMDCPTYTEVPVTIISHCREYGNLNAMAWPEKIAHENELTMAAHARTAETYLLDRIKAQSILTTQAALGSVMNAYASLVHAIQKSTAAIRFRLRMDRSARFRVILPAWIPDLLAADAALAQFDRFQLEAALIRALEGTGISITWHLDSTTGEEAETDWADQTAGALVNFPNEVEYGVHAEGAFIHVDSGTLELGLVRDSDLNHTNDFEFFGESFENVALLGPPQSALWVTQAICANGVFPALGTAPTCS